VCRFLLNCATAIVGNCCTTTISCYCSLLPCVGAFHHTVLPSDSCTASYDIEGRALCYPNCYGLHCNLIFALDISHYFIENWLPKGLLKGKSATLWAAEPVISTIFSSKIADVYTITAAEGEKNFHTRGTRLPYDSKCCQRTDSSY